MNGCGTRITPSASGAYVGAGSNLGDRWEMIHEAARQLRATPGIIAVTSSPVYETRPVGPVGPEPFLNAVFQLSLRLSPLRLFHRLQEIETALGRRLPHGGPRPIDLDLLFFDDLVFQSESLIVPHPRAHLRAFVLQPLSDLAPDFCHPESGFSVKELLAALPLPNEIIGCVAGAVALDGARIGT